MTELSLPFQDFLLDDYGEILILKHFSEIDKKIFLCTKGKTSSGTAIKNLLIHHQFNLSSIYNITLMHFDIKTAIPVKLINGDIFFIYAKEDLMWPSSKSVNYMVDKFNGIIT